MKEPVITGQAGGLAEAQEITQDLYLRFIAYLDAAPKTVETYTKALHQFFLYTARHAVRRPVREDVIAYRESLKADGKKPTTVQNYITAVRLFFSWTEAEGLYPNIAAHVKGAKISRDHKRDYLTSKQMKRVFSCMETETLRGRRNFALVALMTTGGLRDIEAARANIEDLRTLGDDTVLFIQGKGRDEKSDYIKVQPPVEAAVLDWLSLRREQLGEAALQSPLFVSLSNNSRGERMTTRSISGVCKEALRNAGFDSSRLTAHSLRHTAVTLSLLGGKTLQEAGEFARHQNLETTLIYAHNLDRASNNCEEVIAKAIF